MLLTFNDAQWVIMAAFSFWINTILGKEIMLRNF